MAACAWTCSRSVLRSVSACTFRWQTRSRGVHNSTQRAAEASSSSGQDSAAATSSLPVPPPPPPPPPDHPASMIRDLEAKLAVLSGAGIERDYALRHLTPFLCSPAHHIAVRFAFLQAQGKLRQPPRLYKIICPSDDEVCQLHGEQVEELVAFKRRHLASPAWQQFCQYYEVQQAQPDAEPA